MTNRSNPKSKIRCVNLTFQPQQQSSQKESNGEVNRSNTQANNTLTNHVVNGFRPHQYHHGGQKGSKKNISNRLSTSKSVDYHRKLREDIDKLFDDDLKEKTRSPRRTPKSNKNEGLFGGKNVSASQQEQQLEYIRLAQALLEENKSRMSSRSSLTMPTYHRASSAHQFLEATEISPSDVDAKLGRPTRTTLLRNRQRTASAPLSNYEIRREAKKRAHDIIEQRSRPQTAVSHKEILFMPSVEKGDTAYAFLTGARYNRAHYLDSKSLNKYGMYMPRDNPLGTFVNPKRQQRMAESPETPAAPPTPAYTPTPDHTEVHPRSHTPVSKSRLAWTETSTMSTHPEPSKPSGMHEVNEPAAAPSSTSTLDSSALNITGLRIGGTPSTPINTPRLKTVPGRFPTTPKSTDYGIIPPPRELNTPQGLPAVKGKAIYQVLSMPDTAIRHTQFANQARPSPVASPRDVFDRMDILNIEDEIHVNGIADRKVEESDSNKIDTIQEDIVNQESLDKTDNVHVTNQNHVLDGSPEEVSELGTHPSPLGADVDAPFGGTPDNPSADILAEQGNFSNVVNDQESLGAQTADGTNEGDTGEGALSNKPEDQSDTTHDDNIKFFLTEKTGESLVNGVTHGDPEASVIEPELNQEGPEDREEEKTELESEFSATSARDTPREFVPVISVDISKKSSENIADVMDGEGDK